MGNIVTLTEEDLTQLKIFLLKTQNILLNRRT